MDFDPSKFKTGAINKPQVDPQAPVGAFDPVAIHQRIAAEKESARIAAVELQERPLGPIKAWSFSRLMEFEKCPYATKLKVIDRCPDPSGPAADRGSQIHTAIEDFIQGEVMQLDKEVKHCRTLIEEIESRYESGVVEVEQDWAFTREWDTTGWRDDNCWNRTKLDAFVHEGETSAWIIDWKTGKKFGNEIKHGQQLQLYAITAFLRYPKLQFIRAQMAYVDKNEEMVQSYTREQAMMFLDRWDQRAHAMTTATEFPAKPSKYTCRWCPHAKLQEGRDQPACDFRDDSLV